MKSSILKFSVCAIVFLITLQISQAVSQENQAVVYAKEAVFIGIPPANILSVSMVVEYSVEETLLVVPDDRSFMLTDVTVVPIDPGTRCLISIKSIIDPEVVKISIRAQYDEAHSVNMRCGIPYPPGDRVIAGNPAWGSSDSRVTISGYYFGFTQ